jgi:hypothetical protein
MGGAEEVLFSFGKSYNHLPHCTGEAQYCLIKKNDKQCSSFESNRKTRDATIELEKTSEKHRKSIQLTTLLNKEFTSGRLNTRTVFLNIATMKKGDVFVSNYLSL